MNKTLKYFLIALPVLTGGAIVYWQVRKYRVPGQKPMPPVSPGITTSNSSSNTTQPPSNTTVSGDACKFPLKKGNYNNTCVGPLQEALGIGIDNDFGQDTENALFARTGKKQIASAAELSSVINQLNAVAIDTVGDTFSKSAQLLSIYQTNIKTLKYLQMLKATSLKKVQHDPDNEEWVRLPFLIDLGIGQRLNLKDYVPVTSPDNATGNVVIFCNKGGNSGSWMLSPNDFVFV